MIHQECLYKLWSPVLLCKPIISSTVSSCWVCQPSLNLETLAGQFPMSPGNRPSLRGCFLPVALLGHCVNREALDM